MIYVISAHWQADFWIDAQISRLRKYIRDELRIFAFCDGTKEDHSAKFDYCSPVKGIADHATKLNALADIVCQIAHKDDTLIFCDSDAFPIRDITEFVRTGLEKYPLIAVQRLENGGDIQPHPCFAVTTAGFWRAIEGDWRKRHPWKNSFDKIVTDVGGNLLRQLEAAGVEWGKMHRTNAANLHRLFFGVYDDVVYHHGGGSRPALGGRIVRYTELSGLSPADAAAREQELLRNIEDTSQRVIDVIGENDDDKLLDVVARNGFEIHP